MYLQHFSTSTVLQNHSITFFNSSVVLALLNIVYFSASLKKIFFISVFQVQKKCWVRLDVCLGSLSCMKQCLSKYFSHINGKCELWLDVSGEVCNKVLDLSRNKLYDGPQAGE